MFRPTMHDEEILLDETEYHNFVKSLEELATDTNEKKSDTINPL